MKILITGGAGFVGCAARAGLARSGDALCGRPIESLVLADQVEARPELLADARRRSRVGPLLDQCAALRERAIRRCVPPGIGRVGRMRSRLRTRPALQPGQHARTARCAARPHRGRCARHALRLLEFGRGIRARSGPPHAGGGRRRHLAGTADLVRHAQADLRAPGRRLHPQGLHRRPRGAADDGDGATRPAQRRRQFVLQRNHSRAAGRRGGDPAGLCRRLASGLFAAPHRRRTDRGIRGQPRGLPAAAAR